MGYLAQAGILFFKLRIDEPLGRCAQRPQQLSIVLSVGLRSPRSNAAICLAVSPTCSASCSRVIFFPRAILPVFHRNAPLMEYYKSTPVVHLRHEYCTECPLFQKCSNGVEFCSLLEVETRNTSSAAYKKRQCWRAIRATKDAPFLPGWSVLCYFSPKRGVGCASGGDQQPRTPVDSTLAARPLSNKWQLYGVEWNYW